MSDKLKRTLIGALISVALAAAVSYGLITQDTANTVQTRADQALSESGQTTAPNAPAQPDPAPQAAPQPAPRP